MEPSGAFDLERAKSVLLAGEGDKPWIATLPGRVAAGVPFGPDPRVNGCSGLIAIYGASFSGSTMVNAVLGAHPLIFGGGELFVLVDDRVAARCAVCRSQCRYWTEEARASITPDNIYHQISRLFGRPFIADSSKMRDWFLRILPNFPALRISRVLLVKHPVRHVSSFLEKHDTLSLPGGTRAAATWDRVLVVLRNYYELFTLPGETDLEAKYNLGEPRTPIDLVLRYEDFVASPSAVLAPVLARIGLEYDPRMSSWAQVEHHHLGGDVGPLTQIADAQPKVTKYPQRGIFLDNSYGDILDLDTIERVLRAADAQWMRKRFGYPIPDIPDSSGAKKPLATASAAVPAAPPQGRSIPLQTPFTPDGGFGWHVRLPPELLPEADGPGNQPRSPWRLLEDEKPTGEPHALHVDIRNFGRGRYSHWKDTLYFSSSDNSDPNLNGRRYRLARGAERAASITQSAADALGERPVAALEFAERVALAPAFRHVDGFAWIAELPSRFRPEGDEPGAGQRSPWRLLENGAPIGRPHVAHQEISELGQGRHSHWRDVLYFSAGDNSDPNANGRRYELARRAVALRADETARQTGSSGSSDPRARAPVAASLASWEQDSGRLAEILRRRGVREVVYFHTDHFEPWDGIEDGLRRLEGFAAATRTCRHGRRLSLFYTPPVFWAFEEPGPEHSAPGYRVPGDRIRLNNNFSPSAAQRCREAVAALCEIGHEFHLHIHHERWTRTLGNDFGAITPWLDRHSSPEMDSERLTLFVRLCAQEIAAETGRPFFRWAFVHGNWTLNASDPRGCMVEDEIPLLMRHGCFGDFTFPAGNERCNPAVCEMPYTCLPAVGPRSYDTPEADPRPLEEGGMDLCAGRFFVWNSPIKAQHSSLDYYYRPNLSLFREPAFLITKWLEESVFLDGALFIKTHAHSLKQSYGLAEGEGLPPHLYGDVVGVFELLERVCDGAQVPLHFLTVSEVMSRLSRFDGSEGAELEQASDTP